MNKNKELLKYYERCNELVDYNKETGVFTRKISRGGRRAGELVGHNHRSGYKFMGVTIDGKYKTIALHRLAWFMSYGVLPKVIDHIDMDKSNNKIRNLRDCSHSQNNMNRPRQSNNTSGVKGVHYNKNKGSWASYIIVNGRQKHLCQTKDFEYACFARLEAEKKYHGEFMYKEENEAET